ncbi:MAG TPA: DMT family transporter [Saprospiraceae bacterium]|nr:DMT family transporter [Saprospiraceae bacterium]
MNSSSQSLKDYLIFIFLCITWGSSFILIKKGLIAFDPVEVAILRIGITALAFIPIYALMVKGRFPLHKMKYAVLAGLLGNGIPAFLYAIAQTHVESSVAGILNSLTPIFVWVIGLLFFATHFRITQLAGVVIGFLGAAAIVLLNHRFQFRLDSFTLLIVLATVCYGLSANVVKTYLQDVNAIALSAMALFIIGIPAIAYSFFTDIYTSVVSESAARLSLLALIILALVGTALANILFYRLIQKTSAVFASSVAYLIPVTALGWGLLDGEALAAIHLLGMGLILVGVWLLRR